MRPISQPTAKTRNQVRSKSLIIRQRKIATTTPLIKPVRVFPWKIVARIALSALVTALVVWMLSSPLFLVRKVTVDGLQNVSETAILTNLPLHRNLWVYPTVKVAAQIKSATPLVADVAVYKEVPDRLRIVVAERVLALVWQSGDQTYIIGLDGEAIMPLDRDLTIPKVVDRSGINLQAGMTVVTPGFVDFVTTTAKLFQPTVGLEIDHFEVSDTTFDVSVVPKSGPVFLLDTLRDPLTQLQAGKQVLDQFPDKAKGYIDLRVPERAYIK